MQLLSLGAQYVVTALIMLGKKPVGEPVSAAELAKPLNSPATYLSQMLAKLNASGIVGSKRGINGGVYLEKNPADIRLIDIVREIDGDSFFSECFFGVKGCGHSEPCPFHYEWGQMRGDIMNWLVDTTLEDLCNQVTDKWMDERLNFKPKVFS
jgi:Rrf2 family protein